LQPGAVRKDDEVQKTGLENEMGKDSEKRQKKKINGEASGDSLGLGQQKDGRGDMGVQAVGGKKKEKEHGVTILVIWFPSMLTALWGEGWKGRLRLEETT